MVNVHLPSELHVLLLLSAQKRNFFSTDESSLPTTVTAGYNWTQLISTVVLVFLIAVIGIGIWWLLHSVGKPDLVISSDTYQLHDLLCSYTCLGHCN